MIEEKELLRGLTTAEAERRLKQHGLNVLEERKLYLLLKYFGTI